MLRLGIYITVKCNYIDRGVHMVRIRITVKCNYIDRGVHMVRIRV